MKEKTATIIKTIIWLLLSAFAVFIVWCLSVGAQLLEECVMLVIGSTAWGFIYMALPVILFTVLIVLKFTLKLNLKKATLLSAISIALYTLIAFGTIFAAKAYLRDYTPEKWNTYPSERYHMLYDMAKEIQFIGMQKEEVIKILGEQYLSYADPERANLIEYYIGSDFIDPLALTFVFEDNKVVEVYEYCGYPTTKKSLY